MIQVTPAIASATYVEGVPSKGVDLMLRLILACTFALLLSAPLTAADASELGVRIEFTDLEISAIRAYYRDQSSPSASHGNARSTGRKSLPPGIAKNLQRGKSLPPGIAKQALPSRLVQLLPAAPRGYERVVVAGKILLVEIATQVIHDVLEDIVMR